MDLRPRIQQLIDSFPLQETEEEDIKVEAIFHEFVNRIPLEERREAGAIIRELMQERRERINVKKYISKNLNDKFKNIEGVVSMGYIAKYYFGKDEIWFKQRINSDIVNGKPVNFNDEELEQLKHALCDIKNKLSETIKKLS